MNSDANAPSCSSLTKAALAERVLIAGASGLIGRGLVRRMAANGGVVRLVRRPARAADEVSWDPANNELSAAALEDARVVINLAGANVGDGRWTEKRREAIRRSRVETTRTLVQAMARARRRPEVFVCASAAGFYGSRGDEQLTEESAGGAGFLAEVCAEWEAEALAAEQLGVRVVRLRFGVVLAREGGALAKLLPVFRCGLGGRIGDGRQWMSWIALEDAVDAIVHTIAVRACAGAINLTAPEPVTNAEFTAALAAVLRRPAFCAVPAGVLRLVLGRMADETILASTRAVPERLLATGFGFRAPGLRGALEAILTGGE